MPSAPAPSLDLPWPVASGAPAPGARRSTPHATQVFPSPLPTRCSRSDNGADSGPPPRSGARHAASGTGFGRRRPRPRSRRVWVRFLLWIVAVPARVPRRVRVGARGRAARHQPGHRRRAGRRAGAGSGRSCGCSRSSRSRPPVIVHGSRVRHRPSAGEPTTPAFGSRHRAQLGHDVASAARVSRHAPTRSSRPPADASRRHRPRRDTARVGACWSQRLHEQQLVGFGARGRHREIRDAGVTELGTSASVDPGSSSTTRPYASTSRPSSLSITSRSARA